MVYISKVENPITREPEISLSDARQQMRKRSRGSWRHRRARVLAFQQCLVDEKGLPPSRLLIQQEQEQQQIQQHILLQEHMPVSSSLPIFRNQS